LTLEDTTDALQRLRAREARLAVPIAETYAGLTRRD
jgi:hypothetical protein